MRRWTAPLILLLLCNASFAEYIDFMPVVPLVGVIVVIFIAAMNMLATSISNPQLEAWAKTELRELIAGIILIAILTGSFFMLNGISATLTGDDNYMEASIGVIGNMLTNETSGFDRAFEDLLVASSKVRAGATYSPNLSIPLWYVMLSYSTNPYAGIAPILGSLGMGAQALTNAIYLYEGLLMLMKFAAVVVPSMLLPIAFCARLIPFTRKLGNTLISLALAAMIFLPLSAMLVGEINSNVIDYPQASISGRTMESLDSNPWAMVIAEPFCGSNTLRTMFGLTDLGFSFLICSPLLIPPLTVAYPACTQLMQYTVYPIISNVFYIAHAIVLAIWIVWAEMAQGSELADGSLVGWAQDVFDVVYPFLMEVNNLVLLSYLELILIAIITVSGARSISAALGGEWYMAGIERLV